MVRTLSVSRTTWMLAAVASVMLSLAWIPSGTAVGQETESDSEHGASSDRHDQDSARDEHGFRRSDSSAREDQSARRRTFIDEERPERRERMSEFPQREQIRKRIAQRIAAAQFGPGRLELHADSPAVLLARAEELGLTEQQQDDLQKLDEKSRRQAQKILDKSQRKEIKEFADYPLPVTAFCPMPGGKRRAAAMETPCPMCMRMMQMQMQKGKGPGKKDDRKASKQFERDRKQADKYL